MNSNDTVGTYFHLLHHMARNGQNFNDPDDVMDALLEIASEVNENLTDADLLQALGVMREVSEEYQATWTQYAALH